MAKISCIAHVADELEAAWLQHLRDFDAAHPGCHFEVVVESETAKLSDILHAIDVDPKFDLTLLLKREPEGEA